ncbi:MAG TPA: hypothetical protein VF230_03545 [Acidimicrobiales bacterium]
MGTRSAHIDPKLDEALHAAVETCRDALVDYRAGILDDDGLRRVLVGAGIVRAPDEVWLLDLDSDRWWRYDGVALAAIDASATNGAVGRLRDVIHELGRDAGAASEREDQPR